MGDLNKAGQLKYAPNIHHRRSIRLKGYDYSQKGLYFVSICTQNREYLFGNIIDGIMIMNDAGKMVESQWLALSQRYQRVDLNEYVVMPNHFHGIFTLNNHPESVGAPLVGALSKDGQPQGIAPTDRYTVGDIIGAFKSLSTNEYIRGVKNNNWRRFNKKLWQRNYWERIIRDENEYHKIADYINQNPSSWHNDKLNNEATIINIDGIVPINRHSR